MYLSEIKPSPNLASFVRLYRIIDFQFPHNDPIPPKAYTPRPEQCLQFFTTPTKFEYPNDRNKSITPKNALFVGQHTITNNRTVFKKFLSLQIVFQPGALYRLLEIPLGEFTNQLIEAELILGKEIEHANDQLFHAKDHKEMIIIAERFLLAKVKSVKKDIQRIDLIAQQMLDIREKQSLE